MKTREYYGDEFTDTEIEQIERMNHEFDECIRCLQELQHLEKTLGKVTCDYRIKFKTLFTNRDTNEHIQKNSQFH